MTEEQEKWYERETAAFRAWWEADGEKTYSETPTMAAGAGWLKRAESAAPPVSVADTDIERGAFRYAYDHDLSKAFPSEKSAPLDQTIRLLIKGWESADDADHCNMLRNVDAALGEYVSAPSAIEPSKWIAVEDRLPTQGMDVLIYHVLGDRDRPEVPHAYDVGWLLSSGWYFPWDRAGRNKPMFVTHWMPLPEAP